MKGWCLLALLFVLPSPAAAVPPPLIPVGIIAPLSGVRADGGKYVLNGAALAAERLKAEGINLALLVEDSRYEPKEAVSALQKLLTRSVRFVVLGGSSSEVLAAAPITESHKVITLVPGAQSEEIADAGTLIFRLMHNTAQEPQFFGPEIARRMRGESLAVLAAQFAATPPYLRRLRPILKQYGKTIGMVEEFEAACTDFRSRLMRVKASGAEDLLIIAPGTGAAYAMVQARELHLDVRFFGIGIESPDFLRIAGPSGDGLIYAYSFDPVISGEKSSAFAGQYRRRFGSEPDAIAANTYDSLMLLAACVTHDPRTEAVAECLYAVKDYPGVGGKVTIGSNGDAARQLFLKTVRDGKYVVLEAHR